MALALEEPDQATIHLRNLGVRLVTHRGHVDRRPVVPLLVHHLIDEGGDLVDRHAGPHVVVALRGDRRRPLVAGLELQVFQPGDAIVALGRGACVEVLAGFCQDFLVLSVVLVGAEHQILGVVLAALAALVLHHDGDAVHAGRHLGHPDLAVVLRAAGILNH